MKKLQEKLRNLLAKLRAMQDAADFDQTAYDTLLAEAQETKSAIDRLKAIEALGEISGDPAPTEPAEPSANNARANVATAIQNMQRQNAQGRQTGDGVQGDLSTRETREVAATFRLTSFINDLVNNMTGSRPLSGMTAEIAEEARIEADAYGYNLEGLGIPQKVLAACGTAPAEGFERLNNRLRAASLPEFRNDMVADTATAGGHLIPTLLQSPIDILRESLRVRQMGATVLTGLSGTLDFPKWAKGSNPAVKAENAAADEYTPSLSKFTMAPQRLPITTEISKKLLVQTSVDVEAWLRREIAFRQSTVIDADAITTILAATSGAVNLVALGTNGAAPTYESLIDLETAIAEDNADIDVMGFLTTPGVKGKMKKTKLDAGSGQFVWQQGSAELNGYRALTSTNVPSNLTKGSGTDLHAILFGVWSQLIIGQWGGLDLVVNPYSRDTEGLIRITLTTFYDIALRHEEAFAVIKDASVA